MFNKMITFVFRHAQSDLCFYFLFLRVLRGSVFHVFLRVLCASVFKK